MIAPSIETFPQPLRTVPIRTRHIRAGRSLPRFFSLVLALAFGTLPLAADPGSAPGKDPSPADSAAAGKPAPQDSAAARKPAAKDSAGAAAKSDEATGKEADSLQAKAQADSAEAGADTSSSRVYEYIAHPLIELVTLPVDMVLVPAVKALVYPMKAPIRYALRNDVIDRTIDLISFGRKDQVMLYPTLNLAPGTGSYTGLTLRHGALFGNPDIYLVAMGTVYVNGDWKFRGYTTFTEMFGTTFDGKGSLQLNRVKNTSVNQPGTNEFWFYADSSNVLYGSLSHPVYEKLYAKVIWAVRDNHYGNAPPQEDSLVGFFWPVNAEGVKDPTLRGLNSNWIDNIISVGIQRDTRNNKNVTLEGSNLRLSAGFHFTNAEHNYWGWEGTWTGYYKLGKERYEITAEEEKKAGGINMRKLLKQVENKNLREQLLNRKVVVLQAYSAQSFEVPGNLMPVYGLNTLGNDTPMRGYGGARFKDYTILAVSGEYRFPLMRIMDGVIFNEYGVFGRSWDTMPWLDNFRNSWGFGVNVRRPDIFLFRAQMGFHGLHGIQLNISVDTPY